MSSDSLHFTLDAKTIEALKEYSELLKRSTDVIIKEALEDYFAKVEKELLEKAMADENTITTLSYDEFWDGVDIEE